MKKMIVSCSVLLFAVALAMTAAEKAKNENTSSSSSNATAEHKMFGPNELKWGDMPPGLPAGGKMAVLDGDPTKAGSFTVRLQSPDGYKIMPHTHPTVERVTVISGTIYLGMGDKFQEAGTKELTAGSFAALPKNMSHYLWKTTGEAVVQIDSEGPFQIKYVNPSDDPRNAKQ